MRTFALFMVGFVLVTATAFADLGLDDRQSAPQATASTTTTGKVENMVGVTMESEPGSRLTTDKLLELRRACRDAILAGSNGQVELTTDGIGVWIEEYSSLCDELCDDIERFRASRNESLKNWNEVCQRHQVLLEALGQISSDPALGDDGISRARASVDWEWAQAYAVVRRQPNLGGWCFDTPSATISFPFYSPPASDLSETARFYPNRKSVVETQVPTDPLERSKQK